MVCTLKSLQREKIFSRPVACFAPKCSHCTLSAIAIAADHDSPHSAPRSAENDLRVKIAKSVPRPGDRSSASALASFESQPHRRSTAQTPVRRAVVQTSERAHSLPSPPALSVLAHRGRDKTFRLLHGAPGDVLVTLQCPYPPMQFAECPDGNPLL